MLQTRTTSFQADPTVEIVYCAASPSPPDVLSDHGESSVDALRFGAAVKIASTPATNLIAVAASDFSPAVARITTASPFCKSASLMVGIRLNMRCKSEGPFPPCAPPCPPCPPPCQLPCPRPPAAPCPACELCSCPPPSWSPLAPLP